MNFLQLNDDKLNVMNFLNEVAMDFPDAISFASGRPQESFFDLNDWPEHFNLFKRYLSDKDNLDSGSVNNILGQYGRTAGCINSLVAEQLINDETIDCSGDQLLITNGCQEAMNILLLAGCQNKVLLVSEPTYIGITGLASILGNTCISVSDEQALVSCDGIERGYRAAKALGKTVAALYLIPDFDNPSGESISIKDRLDIIELCWTLKISIFEDNPYGMFHYNSEKKPTLYRLDDKGVVYHLGSYSKTMCPTLRIGYILAPVKDFNGRSAASIIAELTKVKSLTSVNTSQLAQAVAGGILLKNRCSLVNHVSQAKTFYQHNRNVIIEALTEAFADMSEKVSWNNPQGGFFISVKMPFIFDQRLLKICAEKYGFLCMPRAYFSLSGEPDEYIRLSFSYVTENQIRTGINALKAFTVAHLKTLAKVKNKIKTS